PYRIMNESPRKRDFSLKLPEVSRPNNAPKDSHPVPISWPKGVSFDPVGRYTALICQIVWVQGHGKAVGAWSSSSKDRFLAVWTGGEALTILAKGEELNSVRFCVDGNLVATGSADGIAVYNMRTAKLLHRTKVVAS